MIPFEIKRDDFPQDFRFGVATSSYQIEGTAFGTCGPNHWDRFAKSGGTLGHQDGSIACAHFEKWPEDLDLIKDCGLQAYRFSTAWPRIQPEGKGAALPEGLAFYDALIDGILERGLEPHLTLYHWDLPQALADKGGWTNSDTAKRFADFSAMVSNTLGDRLASIATINEPWCVAWLSHFLGHHAPGLQDLSAATKAMHNILLAHGLGLEAMRANGQEQIGIVLNMEYAQAASDSSEDQLAAQLQDGLYNRWYADAVFKGTYPQDVLQHVSNFLPDTWEEDLKSISQPLDWVGLNYYTRNIIQFEKNTGFPFGQPVQGPLEKTHMGWEIYPEGLGFFLNRFAEDYKTEIPIYVTENGMASDDSLQAGVCDDPQRIAFFDAHLKQTLNAIEKGANVKAYFAWSLLDNFEWAFGYDKRFGLVHVDFETQKRTPKASYLAFERFMKGLN